MKNKSKLRKLSGLEVLTQKKALTFIHIPFENMPTKRWTGIYILYYFNLVEAIIGHQKLHLTCRKLRSFCTGCTSIKTRSYLAIKSSSMLTGKIFSGIIRHDNNILRMKTIQKEHWPWSKLYWFLWKRRRGIE